jgi:transcriptional/translational regulatory protein YebC/TACO1
MLKCQSISLQIFAKITKFLANISIYIPASLYLDHANKNIVIWVRQWLIYNTNMTLDTAITLATEQPPHNTTLDTAITSATEQPPHNTTLDTAITSAIEQCPHNIMLDTAITSATEQCPHNILAFISQLLLHNTTERLQDKKQFFGTV